MALRTMCSLALSAE